MSSLQVVVTTIATFDFCPTIAFGIIMVVVTGYAVLFPVTDHRAAAIPFANHPLVRF